MLIDDPNRFWLVASYLAMGVVPLILIATVILWLIGLSQEDDENDDDEESSTRVDRQGVITPIRYRRGGRG